MSGHVHNPFADVNKVYITAAGPSAVTNAPLTIAAVTDAGTTTISQASP